jgi:hypothetical protein
MPLPLDVINLSTATFECTFGRGCDGVCCKEGRPPLYPEEVQRLADNLHKILPRLRPAAQAVVRKLGFTTTTQRRFGLPLTRNAAGWCVFFNGGCALHQLGVEDGDKFLYKPAICALFPIQTDDAGHWYVRQHGYKREKWDLFCLSPGNSTKLAAETLGEELALASKFEVQAGGAADL